MRKNQKGFSAIEGLLILVIVGIIGGTGWYVWDRNNSESTNTGTPTSSEEKKETVEENLVSKNWKRYKSGQSAFSIKLADGLNGLRDTSSDFFIFRLFTTNEGPAVVEDIDGYGSDGFFALIIDNGKTSDMWTPTKQLNLKKETFITRNGIKGTKSTYSDPYEPPCEGIGCYLGDKHVVYDFTDSKTGMNTRVWYSRRVTNEETKRIYEITKNDPDYTDLVDEMVKTLEIQE